VVFSDVVPDDGLANEKVFYRDPDTNS